MSKNNEVLITRWFKYWDAAHMVNFSEINSLEDMIQARKYCKCMRVGVFTEDVITTEEMWNVLRQSKE